MKKRGSMYFTVCLRITHPDKDNDIVEFKVNPKLAIHKNSIHFCMFYEKQTISIGIKGQLISKANFLVLL